MTMRIHETNTIIEPKIVLADVIVKEKKENEDEYDSN